MEKKTMTRQKILKYAHIKFKYGTTDKDDTSVVFATAAYWLLPLKPISEEEMWWRLMQIKNSIEKKVAECAHFQDRLIFAPQDASYNLTAGIPKFITFDFFVKQKRNPPLSLLQLKDAIGEIGAMIEDETLRMSGEDAVSVRKQQRQQAEK